jgi:quinol-cytochrome oxidoreductase complex cytochrome b subunit
VPRLEPVVLPIPGLLAGLALFFFCTQILTGVLLVVYYNPSAELAHRSIGVIVDEVRFGWLVRSAHYWGTHLFILTSLLHLIGVYFRRAYVDRRVAWVTGVLLLVVALAFGFTGTLLPWDQDAYWSIEAARQVVSGIPIYGNFLLGVFWGGWELGPAVLLRFYAFHVGILPWAAALLLLFHLVSARLGSHHRSRPLEEATTIIATRIVPLWVALSTLALLFPPLLGDPADPLAPFAEAGPRWYLVAANELLVKLPGTTAAFAVVLGFGLVLVLVPLIDRREIEPAARRVVRWSIGVGVVAVWIFLTLRNVRF